MQTFEYHLNLLNNLKKELNELQLYLEDITEQYKNQINKLDAAGFAKNFVNPMNEKYVFFEARINDLQRLINRHKMIIEKQESKLQHIIQSARS